MSNDLPVGEVAVFGGSVVKLTPESIYINNEVDQLYAGHIRSRSLSVAALECLINIHELLLRNAAARLRNIRKFE